MDPVEMQTSAKVSRISAGVVPYARAIERYSTGKAVVLGGGAPALIEKGDAAFTPEANVTITLVAGLTGNVNQIAVAAGFTAPGLAASKSYAEKDLSGLAEIRCLIKSSVAQAAEALQIGVSETSGMGGAAVWSNLPALEAGKWYLVSVPFTGDVALRNAAISVGLKVIVDFEGSVFLGEISAGAKFNGIGGFADDDAVGYGHVGVPADEYASGKDFPVLCQGLVNAKLAAGVVCVADQRLYPVPGGDLHTTEVIQPGPVVHAKADQATAGGRVAVIL